MSKKARKALLLEPNPRRSARRCARPGCRRRSGFCTASAHKRPWPFPFQQWVPRQTLADALKHFQRTKNNRREGASQQAALGLLQQHPELVTLVGILLDRGDPDGREFALETALLCPEAGDAPGVA